MRIIILLLVTLYCCGACKEIHDHKGKTPLVEVDGNFLYREDLMSVLPVGLSKDDSTPNMNIEKNTHSLLSMCI